MITMAKNTNVPNPPAILTPTGTLPPVYPRFQADNTLLSLSHPR